jgi:tungstate transport system ATP-binding protein
LIQYELQQVTQQYNGKTVLNIKKLEIESGKIYGLLGANGAGKTTLFNILSFLEAPASGQVVFAGQSVFFGRTELHKLRRRVVMVDQYPIMFTTTVFKNIEFGLKIRGMTKERRQAVIDEALDMVDLAAYRGASAAELSGGETQRLALARALALSPEVMLCDEPTANVDVENQAVIRALLTRVNLETRCTILFTSHDRLQAAGLADETVVLEKGELVDTSYENIFSCSLESKGKGQKICLLQQKIPFSLPGFVPEAEGRDYRVYLNPDKIKLVQGGQQVQQRRGVLFGTINLMMAEGEKVRLIVNAGVMVTVLLPVDEYAQLRLAIGDAVTLKLKPDAVEWL